MPGLLRKYVLRDACAHARVRERTEFVVNYARVSRQPTDCVTQGGSLPILSSET